MTALGCTEPEVQASPLCLLPALARRGAGAMALLAFGCVPALQPSPHYVLGKPYRVGSVWFYPRESFDLDQTGLAAISQDSPPRLTTDGEVFDQGALAAGHPTIQLPAIARLTNLDNGRAVLVRLNDRGSGDPHRLVEITRRTALLLGVPAGKGGETLRVRLQVLPGESQAAADPLPGAPSLAIAAAPRGAVEVAELPLPTGAQRDDHRDDRRASPATSSTAPTASAPPPPPLRLPETVTQTKPWPGRLMVRLDTFADYHYAAGQRAKMGAAGARIVSIVEGRTRRFQVELGPFADVAHADAVLDQAFASGIPDARIVVD